MSSGFQNCINHFSRCSQCGEHFDEHPIFIYREILINSLFTMIINPFSPSEKVQLRGFDCSLILASWSVTKITGPLFYLPLYYICQLLPQNARYACWNWATHIFLESSTKGGGSPKTRFFCFTLHEARKKTKTLFKRRGVLANWLFVAISQFFRLLKNYGDNKNHGNKKNHFFFVSDSL